MIRAALFDLDGTLFDRDVSIKRFAADQYARLFTTNTLVPVEHFIQLFIEIDQHGYTPRDRLYTSLCAECMVTIFSCEALRQDFDLHFKRFITPMPSLHEMIDQLHRQEILLGIITNGQEMMQMETVRSLGIHDDFQTIVISGSVGVRKPDPGIFRYALEALAIEATECVFIGDHPDADIQGAAAVGIQPLWKRVPYWPAVDIGEIPIDDLAEIPRILQSLDAANMNRPPLIFESPAT